MSRCIIRKRKNIEMQKILLLEDDFSLADGLRFALEKQGYEVDAKRTIAEAKTAWNNSVFDLLILDVSLPDGSGFDFCRSVRQSSDVPILFLTASDEETSVIMGLDIGGDDYVTKPFRLGILLSRVSALLRRTKADPAENAVLEWITSSGDCSSVRRLRTTRHGSDWDRHTSSCSSTSTAT